MPSALFRQMAAAEGWSESTQIGLLLRFIENRHDPSALLSFLAACRADISTAHTDPADRFMWQVAELLGNPGLALTSAFQDYCRNTHDFLTPSQAAERWCCWTAG